MTARLPIELAVSARFAEERQRLGLAAVEAARICGVDRKTINNWERDRLVPATALSMLAPYGLDVQYVVLGTRSPTAIHQVITGQRQALQHLERAMHALQRSFHPQESSS